MEVRRSEGVQGERERVDVLGSCWFVRYPGFWGCFGPRDGMPMLDGGGAFVLLGQVRGWWMHACCRDRSTGLKLVVAATESWLASCLLDIGICDEVQEAGGDEDKMKIRRREGKEKRRELVACRSGPIRGPQRRPTEICRLRVLYILKLHTLSKGESTDRFLRSIYDRAIECI